MSFCSRLPSETREQAELYALGALSAEEAALFDEHLRGCADCRREIDSLREAAEELLRECLALREKAHPDGSPQAWLRRNTASMLGEALTQQGRFAEAEPLLLGAHEGMKDDPAVPPPAQTGGADRKRQALERVVQLYRAWDVAEPGKGHDEKAREWQARLESP